MPEYMVSAPVFVPNMIDTPSAARLVDARSRPQSGSGARVVREIPADKTAVRLQLTDVHIVDGLHNGFLGFGKATGVYLISTVVDGTSNAPITFQGQTYKGVSNGDSLPLGPHGDPTGVFNVYFYEARDRGKLPRLLSFSLLIIRSNAEMRELGEAITKIGKDDRYGSLSDIVKTAVSAANPAYGVVWQAAQEVMGLFGEYLKVKPDQQLGYYQANFTNRFDDLGEGHHPPGTDRSTLAVDKVRMGYQIDVD
jgi:hypothetical protein